MAPHTARHARTPEWRQVAPIRATRHRAVAQRLTRTTGRDVGQIRVTGGARGASAARGTLRAGDLAGPQDQGNLQGQPTEGRGPRNRRAPAPVDGHLDIRGKHADEETGGRAGRRTPGPGVHESGGERTPDHSARVRPRTRRTGQDPRHHRVELPGNREVQQPGSGHQSSEEKREPVVRGMDHLRSAGNNTYPRVSYGRGGAADFSRLRSTPSPCLGTTGLTRDRSAATGAARTRTGAQAEPDAPTPTAPLGIRPLPT